MGSREIWVVSPLPPPTHGVSAFSQALLEEIRRRGIPSRAFRVGARGDLARIERFAAAKLGQDAITLAGFAAAGVAARGRDVTVYFTPSQYGWSVYRDLALVVACQAFPCRIVAHLHGCRWVDSWRRGDLAAHAMYRVLGACSSVIALGETFAGELRRETGFPCVGIDNGVDVEAGAPGVNDPPRPWEILFLSNLYRAKGLWVAAEATRLLRARGRPAVLRVAGDWMVHADRGEFESEFAPELGSGAIRLEGFAEGEAKRALFLSADAYVLPTLNPHEGQPLTILEAMAYGVPPLASACGGIVDLYRPFSEESRALLASPGFTRAPALADALEALLADRTLRARVGEECRRVHSERFTFHRCADAILAQLS